MQGFLQIYIVVLYAEQIKDVTLLTFDEQQMVVIHIWAGLSNFIT